jgi:hypothetical protein
MLKLAILTFISHVQILKLEVGTNHHGSPHGSGDSLRLEIKA